ncbi:conditioned medium-induced protein 4 [Haloglomus salinum]|jgi:hypothetical protein|uniref:conditioned medium-induced protein 4 n=1 Tax=Haloglomus salinum TaxID=2962673 RepID=UPI0020C9486A|nr:conditioned medium-induced protein 4 [Haloglomus salinum]
MDEKTEELRDIFEEVTGEETVTEKQEESPGTLAGEDDEAVAERLADVVARMREKYEFATDLSDTEYARVVRGYYEGEDDTDIADALDIDRRDVVRARLDVHLVRDRDRDAPFELKELRRLLNADADLGTSDLAEELDVSASTVRRYRRVVETETQIRSVSARYQAEFEDVLTDAGISHDMTSDIQEDGLQDATEGAEAESDMSL